MSGEFFIDYPRLSSRHFELDLLLPGGGRVSVRYMGIFESHLFDCLFFFFLNRREVRLKKGHTQNNNNMHKISLFIHILEQLFGRPRNNNNRNFRGIEVFLLSMGEILLPFVL